MNSSKFKAIVFDFDGTLVETSDIKTNAFAELYADYGARVSEQVVKYHLENEGISRYEKFRHWHENYVGISYNDKIGKSLSKKFSELVLTNVINAPFSPGALEFLKSNHQQFKLFIASGTPEVELRYILTKRKMKHFFHGIYGTPSSKSEILIKVLKSENLLPDQVLMIGDALSDWEGAKVVGVVFLGLESKLKDCKQNMKLIHSLQLLDEFIIQEK